MFAVRPCSKMCAVATTVQQDVRSTTVQQDTSMESKYTDQVYLDLCLSIPAAKIRGYQIPRGIPSSSSSSL